MYARQVNKRVTLADVAAQAGVDRSLVSRVLNNDPSTRARKEVRDRILQVSHDLGYRPNRIARTLRTAQSNTIGLVIPSFENLAWSVVVDGAESEADARGLVLITASANRHSDRAAQFFDLGHQGGLDRILIGTAGQGDLPLKDSSVPWLMIYRRTEHSTRYVVLDDAEASRRATEHLITKGHRNIVHVAGPSTVDAARRRRQGYLDALESEGLTPEGILESDYTFEAGLRAAQGFAAKFPRATGVVVANFAGASGFLTGLRQQGVSVPGTLSVIAIQDHPLADAFAPALTTVRMPLFELGRRAMALLLDSDPQSEIEEIITSGIEIVSRESTAHIT
jgi:LacI family transcriptional regulator